MPIPVEHIKQDRPSGRNSKDSFDWKEFLSRDIRLWGSGWSTIKKVDFYKQLAILLRAGLDIQKALTLIEGNLRKKQDAQLIENIRRALIKGNSLSKSMQATVKFTDYEVFSVKIGEETGHLIQVLEALGGYFKKTVQYRKQTWSALSYPIFVLSFAVLVLAFLLNVLVPMFSQLYDRFDGNLPPITEWVLGLSNWFGKYLKWILLIGLGISLTIWFFRERNWLRKIGAWVLVRIPILGGIIKSVYLLRFTEAMSLLLRSNVPLVRSVRLVKSAVKFYSLEQILFKVEDDLIKGISFYQSLGQSRFFPKSFIALVQVGEESNKLAPMFSELSEQLNEDVDRKTQTIGNLLEPILIIFLGCFVALILISIYLPLFQMSTQMGF